MERRQTGKALEAARQRLALLCGIQASDLGEVRGELTQVGQVPTFEELATRVDRNPDVARWVAEMEQRQAVLNVETSKRIPDVSISAGLRVLGVSDGRERGYGLEGPTPLGSAFRSETKGDSNYDTMLVAGFSMPIPVFDRNQGGIKEAEHLAAKAGEERRAVEMKVKSALLEAHAALAAAYDVVVTTRDTALPKAGEAYRLTEEGYQAGKFDLVACLEAEEILLSLRAQYTTALADYHLAAADVERLIGGPLMD